jgi:hypothetical protein
MKQKTFTKILFITISCLILSCTEQNKSDSNAEHIIYFDTKKSVEKYDTKDLTDGTFGIIPLETTDDCLIANIDKIEIKDERIYVMDQLAQSVYIFDMNGKYLNKIHKRGQGPGEYTNLSYMTVTDSSVIIIDHFTEKQINYSIPSLQPIKEERIFEKIYATEIFYLNGTIYYVNEWSNSPAGKYRLFSGIYGSDNYEKYLPFEEEPICIGINGPVYAINGNEASLIYKGDDNIYRLREGKVFPEYEIRFKDKKVEYSGKREKVVEDFINSPTGRVKGINRINESDKYLFIDIGIVIKNNTIIEPGNYDVYRCIHNKSDHSTVICPAFTMHNSTFDVACVVQKIIDNKIISWLNASLLMAVYTEEEFEKRTFGNKAYEERLKNVLANLTEDDNPVLFIFGLK